MSKSRIVPVTLDSGQVIHAEITPTGGEKDVAGGGMMKFDSVVDSITGIAKQLNGAISAIAPDKATVEFSLQLSSEAGTLTALLVQGEANATVKVALEWKGGASDGK